MATTVSPSAATVSPDIPLKMMTVSRNAAVVLDELTADLNVGDSRKMDRGLGYMRVHVGCLHRSGLGLHYSVAHYYGQNGRVQMGSSDGLPSVFTVRFP